MSGRWLPALILELFIIGYALAKNGGNCNVDITNVPNFWITFTITTNDNIINAEVFNVTYKDELAFTDITYQSGTDLTKYFTASTNNGYLFLSTTPEMANFDQNTPKQTGDISGSFKVNLKCKDGASDFTVTAIVSDYNNHDPQFDQQEYVYNVASPLMPQIDFSVYGSVIKVTDLDFTNQDVTFTLDNEDFTITTIVDAADNKSYIPVFSAKSVIFLSDTRTYTLTAKDSGTNPGPRTSTATIKLVYDESVSLDAPSFGQPAYNFNYTIENDAAVLTPLDGPITLNTAKGDEVVLSIVGDLKDSLNVTITKDSNEITIKVKKPFDDKSLLMVATLEAKTDNAAIASLIFHMPKRSLEFGSHLYTGIYDVTDSTVTLNTAITINAEGLTATPTITVSGDLQEHFEITCKIDTGICDLSVKDLSYNDLQDYLPLELLLTIEVEDKTDTATLIITGNLDKLEFTKPVYQATYNPDDNTVTLEEEIGFNNNNDNINIQTGGSYGTSFELTYSSADKKWNVIVKTPLSQDILESETAIELTLTATDQYKNEAYSTLTVALPKGPRFTKSYFKAKYEKIDDQIINFEDELSFADVDNSIVNIVLDSYEDSFKIEYIDNVWKISVIKPPNDTILQNFSELFITMTAEIKTKTSVGSSVLILELPSNVQPSFKDVLYTTEYPKSGSGIMDFQPALTINDVKDPSTLSLKLSGFQDYFSIVYVNKKWQMQIIKPLDTSILSSHKELSASIYIGEDTTISTVLVISLPEIKPPEFSEHHYAGQYINSEPNAEVTLHDVISLTSYDDKVDVKLDNYTTYFDINFNNITKECNVTVKNPLDTNILNSNVYIVIGISAQDSFGTTIASLVLDLPTEEAPKFTQLHYSLTYQKDSQEITYDNPIQISNIEDSTKADIAIEKPYQSNFNVTYNKDTSAWELNVASLPKENPAAVTLSAKDKINKKTGETTVIFNVPEQIDVPPVFSEAHYFATYAISNNKGDITEADPIQISNKDINNIKLSLDKYASNFDFDLDEANKQWNLKLTQDLPDDVLQQNTELILTITASEIDNVENTAQSTLVIYLPSITNENYLNFTSVYYSSEYKTGADQLDVEIQILSNKDLSDAVLIVASDDVDFNTYFSFTNKSGDYGITVNEPIPDDILQQKNNLVYTLTATLEDLTSESVLIINFPKNTNESIHFSDVLYTGSYKVTNGKIDLTTDKIEVVNPDATDIVVSLTGDSSYINKFHATYSNNEVKVTVDSDFTSPAVDTIVLVLNIEVDGTKINSAVLNIAVEGSTDNIKFEKNLYNGKYTVESKEFLFEDTININTNKADDEITASILEANGEVSKNFNGSYAKNVFKIELTQPLDDTIVKNSNFLTIIPTVTVTGTSLTASTIVNIDIVKTEPGTGSIEFSNSLYNGNYTVTGDSTGEIVYDEISITTDQTDVNVSITNDYSQYFTSNYKNDKVSIETKGISSDVLVDITFIPLQLEAHSRTNPNIKATAILNLNIIGSTDYIGFEKNLYNGKYTVESKEFLFEDTININTNMADGEVTASILEENGEVSKNFKGSYAKNVFKIELTQPLDDTVVKNSNFLTIIPTVTVTGTSLSASTIVNIDIVKDQPDSGSIVFSSSLYNGNYTVTGDGTGEIEYDDITITTDQAEIKLGVTNEFTDYFTISDINNTVTIETKGVPSNVLAGLTFIPLLLEAQSTTNPNIKASAVLNFNIIGSTDYIEFEKNLYNGKYTVESKEFLFEDTININTNKADDEITASILEENGAVSKNFKGSYAKNVFKIELTQPLDDTIVKNSNFLTIIPTVTVTGTSLSASTIVNIDIVKTEPGTGSIEFSNSLYNGNYTVTGDSTGEIVYDEISITTDQTDVNVSITNDYSQYFTSNYKNDKVSIETKGISSDVLVDITFIPLQLEAHSTTNPNIKATAVLNLNIIGSTDYIEFEKNLYNGKYTVESQEFLFEDTININTNKADDEITASILEENGAVSKNFKGSYAKNVFKIELTAPLDDTIVKNSNFLTIIPTVTVTGTSLSASTIVNIDIVKNEPETGHIEFSSTLYNGNYKVIDQGTGTVECENISLTTDQTDIEVTITNGYAEYFKVTYADNIVTLTTTVVPPNILANKTYIPLLLEAHSKANQNIKSSTVVTLNIIDNQQVDYSIAFEKPQYTGHYVIDLLGPGEFTIDGDINILTNYYDAHMYSSITDDNGNNFAKYFFSEMSNNKYTVGITDKYLSEDIYNNNDVISLILQAGIASENLVARTILNIQISRNYGSLKFSELLYEGSYTVSDDNTAVVSHGDIPLITPYTYDNMQIGIAADTQFFDYFNASVSGKNLVTIQSTKFIESYADFGSIPVNIQAEIPVHGTVLSANSILNLKVIDSSKNKSVLQFNEILYNAEYIVKDRKLNVDDKITIMSDADEKDIKSYFTAAENFKTFLTNFEAKYSNHAVTVNKLKDIDEKLLINIPYISLTLVLEVESTKTTANAVFNIKIAESAMKFNETLYKAEYVVKDSKFYIGKLALNSEIVYDNIDTAITSSSGFDKYFNCSYSKNEILIGLSEPIPASELKNVSYIPLTLKATVPDIGKEDSTIVTIKVIEPSDVNPDDGSGSNSDNTGYIIAVVILSLLIIALIAAGIAYYYFKLRNRDYTDVDPDFWKVRFAKNAEKKKKKEKYGDSNIENRRPTGFVFNPLEEEHEEETSTDPTERRKSVLFDENVEKINIEPTIDEDVVEKQNGTTQST